MAVNCQSGVFQWVNLNLVHLKKKLRAFTAKKESFVMSKSANDGDRLKSGEK